MADLRYPIGKAEMARELTADQRLERIARIESAPERLREAVAGLDDGQLDTPYRPEGWTVRQVVHHVPDSHLNAYLRCKWALTEDEPAIKTYDEATLGRAPGLAHRAGRGLARPARQPPPPLGGAAARDVRR